MLLVAQQKAVRLQEHAGLKFNSSAMCWWRDRRPHTVAERVSLACVHTHCSDNQCVFLVGDASLAVLSILLSTTCMPCCELRMLQPLQCIVLGAHSGIVAHTGSAQTGVTVYNTQFKALENGYCIM
jgi:hypothetical protein